MTSPPEEFRRFVRAAGCFCALVEEPLGARERAEFVWAVRTELAELLAAAFRLPEPVPAEHAFPDSIATADWNKMYGAVQLRIGELGSEPGASALVADDLADIWRDLRTGLNAMATESRWEDVGWERRFGLQTHWGKHAVDALAALHDA
jgi:hypothetical protein